jgi:hypothetical protein
MSDLTTSPLYSTTMPVSLKILALYRNSSTIQSCIGWEISAFHLGASCIHLETISSSNTSMTVSHHSEIQSASKKDTLISQSRLSVIRAIERSMVNSREVVSGNLCDQLHILAMIQVYLSYTVSPSSISRPLSAVANIALSGVQLRGRVKPGTSADSLTDVLLEVMVEKEFWERRGRMLRLV